jgi:subtilisin family serine protease
LRRINATAAWEKGATGKGAVIAILDSGIDLGHPDLRARLVPGIDLTSDSDCPGPQDESGHGTLVAGVAAATADNGIGIAGVAPQARLMPVRVLTELEGGSPDEIRNTNRTFAKGIKWAADHGADVINISSTLMVATDYPLEDDGLQDALAYAWDKGTVVVAAAGNNLLPICDYPANDAHVLCVGATDALGLPAVYSNQPTNSNSRIGLRAPGGRLGTTCEDSVDIWTTSLPGYCGGINGYTTTQGTSFASPHVAGVAALLAAKGVTNDEIVACLVETALNPLTGLRGQFDPIYGYGEVDALAAVETCA